MKVDTEKHFKKGPVNDKCRSLGLLRRLCASEHFRKTQLLRLIESLKWAWNRLACLRHIVCLYRHTGPFQTTSKLFPRKQCYCSRIDHSLIYYSVRGSVSSTPSPDQLTGKVTENHRCPQTGVSQLRLQVKHFLRVSYHKRLASIIVTILVKT